METNVKLKVRKFHVYDYSTKKLHRDLDFEQVQNVVQSLSKTPDLRFDIADDKMTVITSLFTFDSSWHIAHFESFKADRILKEGNEDNFYKRINDKKFENKDLVSITEKSAPENALDVQVGGGHYKDMKIQVVEFTHANNLDAFQYAVTKYVCRHKKKNGVEDLKKAMHYIQLYAKLEYGVDL